MGLAIAFEGRPGRSSSPLSLSIKSLIFLLLFFTYGLLLLGVTVAKWIGPGDWLELPVGTIATLCCLVPSACGMWIIFQRYRKRRRRS